jgi:hypothetical protein
MNVSEFLFNAKAGILDLSRERPISNKGTIDDIRRREKKQLRPAGFPKFSQLGSQNAISAEPKDKIEVDVKVNDKKPEPAPEPIKPIPEPVKPILPGQTKKDEPVAPAPEEKKTLGGDGGMQSEESRADSAVMPRHEPPYYLPQERSQLNEMTEFLKLRYGDKETRRERDFLVRDSENFSSAVEKAIEINKAILKWRKQDMGNEWLMNQLKMVGSWFLDKVVDFGTGKIDFKTQDKDKPKDKDGKIDESKIDKPKEISLGIATEITKAGVNELKKLVQQTYLKPESFEATMKAIQDTIFAQKPAWKAKWEALLSAEIAKSRKEFIKKLIDFDMAGEKQIPKEIRDKVPFGGL